MRNKLIFLILTTLTLLIIQCSDNPQTPRIDDYIILRYGQSISMDDIGLKMRYGSDRCPLSAGIGYNVFLAGDGDYQSLA